jgi:hypothetical protein
MKMPTDTAHVACRCYPVDGVDDRDRVDRSQMSSRLFSFVGGSAGRWQVIDNRTIAGDPLADVPRVELVSGASSPFPAGAEWVLRGMTSNERYVTRSEKNELVARQQGLGRPEATCAALIPIRKNAAWWGLTQDERRRVFEHDSRHIGIGMQYLPAVARRLHHCRDISDQEPFDFLTWFEYAPADAAAFDRLLEELRASDEWRYVDRETDIRLERT